MKQLMLLLAVLALAASSAWADSIILRGKPALTGVKVVKEDFLEVAYTQGTSTRRRTVATSEVLDVIYDSPPVEYRLGSEALNLGDYVNAIGHLEASLRTEADKAPWVKEYAGLALGRAYLAGARFDDAVKALEGVLTTKPETRFMRKASLALALCHAKRGDASKAMAALDRLVKVVAAKKIPGIWDLEAELMKGEVMVATNRAADAVSHLKSLASKNQPTEAKDPKARIWVRAKRLQVEAHLAAGDTAIAKNVVQELERKRRQIPAAAAGARNAAAAVALAEKGDKDALIEAAEGLVRAKIENAGTVSELPTTCYLLGLIHLGLSGQVANAKPLAKSYFDETLRRFPESREAFLAREQLKKM
jgi:tetratricopeptide (TPR) repeat protein